MLLKEVGYDNRMDKNKGWFCPKCGIVVSPKKDICPECKKSKVGENSIPTDKQVLMG